MAEPRSPEALVPLVPNTWAETFRRVPRELFVPDGVHASLTGEGAPRWVDRSEAPDTWLKAVYDDTVLVTQVSDGEVGLDATAVRTGTASSSSTAPALVGVFLELLDPYPGDRVLEVGTGTGWTAGLLCERLGEDRVTTIEVDKEVAQNAAANLERAGYRPNLVVGDGLLGAPEQAPYDRVHVTCAVRKVPFAWVEQTRPGGVIVAPWAPTRVQGHKLRLTVTGKEAVGRFHGQTSFMMARSQRPGLARPVSEPRVSRPRVDPMRITRAGPGLEPVVVGLLPGVTVDSLGDGADRVGVHDPITGSYALGIRGGEEDSVSEVTEYGKRDLWSELEEAYLAWVSLGEPELSRFGLLVDAWGQHVWLDEPRNRVRPMWEESSDG